MINIARFFIFLTTQIWFDFALIFATYKKIPELLKIGGFIMMLGFGFYIIVLGEIIFNGNFQIYRGDLLFPYVIGALSFLHFYGSLVAYGCFKRLQKNQKDTIYTIVEKTSDVIYKIKKKGGKAKSVHINRLKYYDPETSESDKDTHISNEEDETPNTGPTTRSRDNTLPPPIDRFSATTSPRQNEDIHIARQNPTDVLPSWGSNNNPSNNAAFRALFSHHATQSSA